MRSTFDGEWNGPHFKLPTVKFGHIISPSMSTRVALVPRLEDPFQSRDPLPDLTLLTGAVVLTMADKGACRRR